MKGWRAFLTRELASRLDAVAFAGLERLPSFVECMALRGTEARIDYIMRRAQRRYNVSSLRDIRSPDKSEAICMARHEGIYCAAMLTELPATEIGDLFSRHHTSVSMTIRTFARKYGLVDDRGNSLGGVAGAAVLEHGARDATIRYPFVCAREMEMA